MGKHAPRKRVLTGDEAARAVYLDFEGRKKEDPSFVGAAWDGVRSVRFEQAVLDPRLLSAAKAKTLPRVELRTYLKDLATWVRDEQRVIVAWSEHELHVFEAHADRRDLTVLEDAYRNAIRLAKDRWRRNGHGELDGMKPLPQERSLAAYLDHFGYRVPSGQGPGVVAPAILDVRDGLAGHKVFDELTPVMKGKWTRALGHNRHDCLGLRFVCRRMTGLDDDPPPA